MSAAKLQKTGGNFGFLAVHDRQLVRLAGQAELYCHGDPTAALAKLRLFAERLAQLAAARFNVHVGPDTDQHRLLADLKYGRYIEPQVGDAFHLVRKLGNKAVHEDLGTPGEAVHALKVARMLAAWFHRSFGKAGWKPGPFVVPKPPDDVANLLRQQNAELKGQLETLHAKASEAEEKAALVEEFRRAAEAEAQAAQGDLEAALALAEETEEQKQRFARQLERLQTHAGASSDEEKDAVVVQARKAAADVKLDEAETRKLIDEQLRDAGWEADTENLRHAKGTRPRKGKNLAIAEWPTQTGPADYVLFRGLEPLAVVEAKRKHKNVPDVVQQAKRYSRGYHTGRGGARLRRDDAPGEVLSGPWDGHQIPFVFATNGRSFLRQLQEESGIHFLDLRKKTNHSRALADWYSPDGLKGLLQQDAEAADKKLAETPSDQLPLRPYQHGAVRDVEHAIAQGRREILVAMATGTGKTRTAIGLLYRLVKAKRFRRVLFVVDRTALGEQAHDAFKEFRLESLQSFTEIYDVKGLGDLTPDADTRLHLVTVQSLVKRVLYDEDKSGLGVDTYDCIVIDECHRGYNLDREMSDAELTFKNEADYVSKYRRALDYFDAVKIGLTATPALHTTEIFGEPVTSYGYRQAVVDGFLVDYEPPVRILTKLARDGIHWEVGEDVKVYDTGKGQLDLFRTPDEIHIEVEQFNKTVRTESFNRAVCGKLAEHVHPLLPGKTLVFCVDDKHADLVVRLLKEAFEGEHGPIDDDAVLKITGSVDRPLECIRRYKNEQLPSVAVTVDLLTTGIDVPEIVNLVFLRRVRSRILYEQMLGRATRLCPNLFDAGEHKEVFHVYDAVGLYDALQDYTDMKPVVVNPEVRFNDLVRDLVALADDEMRGLVRDQLIAKLRRKRDQVEKLAADLFHSAAGMDVDALLDKLAHEPLAETVKYFKAHPDLGELLDRHIPKEGQKVFLSEHDDEVVSVEVGFGPDRLPPADYLEAFGRFLKESGNKIPALLAVTQRPRELTRHQLKDLKLALDKEGYGEGHLQAAWRAWKNEDVAASIVGFIRQRALGDPLRPYERRVDDAVARIQKSGPWTLEQRKWIERIGKQMKRETVVDVEALDRGQFKQVGGYAMLDKKFGGKLADVLAELHEEVWRESA